MTAHKLPTASRAASGGPLVPRSSGSPSLTSLQAVCAWIPLFPLRAEERRRPDLIGKPTAILSENDSRRVKYVSSLARHHGVQTGSTVSQAIGLCPALTLLEADPVHYDEQFSRILGLLSQVSPVIEPAELGRVYIGVDGLERLYGEASHQLRRIARAFPSWDGLRLGWAQGKFASWVAAMRARANHPIIVSREDQGVFLANQPLASLPVEPDTHRRLWQLGLKTLGDLAALPEIAVASQFGREGRHAWQLASGVVIEPVTGKELPEPIVSTVDFPVPIADTQTLQQAFETLIRRALRHPRRVGWRVQSFRVRAILELGSSWQKDLTLKDPTASLEHLVNTLAPRIEQAPPAGAVATLTVEFTRFVRGTTELQLFARDASSSARAGRRRALRWAVHEIKARLHRSMLHHIVEVHPWSRIPERRYALIDFDP